MGKALVWLETCLTTLQPNYGSKEVSGTYKFICIVHKIEIICGYFDPNLYYYCRVICGHSMLRLSMQGLMLWGNWWFVLMLGSEAERKWK